MKHTRKTILLAILISLILPVYHYVNHGLNRLNDISQLVTELSHSLTEPSAEMKTSIAVDEPVEIPVSDIKKSAPLIKSVEPKIKVTEETAAVKIVNLIPETPNLQLTNHEIENEQTDEEITLSIIQVTLLDDDAQKGDIIFLPGNSKPVPHNTKGFRLLGNNNYTPVNLIVQSQHENGTESLQFLDWDARHPNQFTLNSPLGEDSSVIVMQNNDQIASFQLANLAGDEIIELSVKLDHEKQLAGIF